MALRWRASGGLVDAAKWPAEAGDTFIEERLHAQLLEARAVKPGDLDGVWLWVRTKVKPGEMPVATMTIAEMQHAARLVEMSGVEAFRTLRREGVPPDVVMALIVAHVRRQLGAMSASPSKKIETDVQDVLKLAGLRG